MSSSYGRWRSEARIVFAHDSQEFGRRYCVWVTLLVDAIVVQTCFGLQARPKLRARSTRHHLRIAGSFGGIVMSSDSGKGLGTNTLGSLTKFAQKAPAIVKNGNKAKDRKLEGYRKAFMQCVSILERDMSQCPLLLTELTDAPGEDNTDEANDKMWPATYHHLYRLPKYWKSAFLVQASRTLTNCHIEATHLQDPEAVDRAFYLLTQTKEKTPLPRECLDKEICGRFFIARLRQVGDHIDGWIQRSLRTDGTLEWQSGMAYDMRYDGNGTLVEVVHVFSNTSAAVPIDPPIQKSTRFELERPEDEMMTTLRVGKCLAVKFADLFAPGTGLHAHHIGPGKTTGKLAKRLSPWARLAETVKNEVLVEREMLASGKVTDTQAAATKRTLAKGDEKRAEDRLKRLETARAKSFGGGKRPLTIKLKLEDDAPCKKLRPPPRTQQTQVAGCSWMCLFSAASLGRRSGGMRWFSAAGAASQSTSTRSTEDDDDDEAGTDGEQGEEEEQEEIDEIVEPTTLGRGKKKQIRVT